jgi:poly-gamma-glutamate biosynthesis protein PgsC/CapC
MLRESIGLSVILSFLGSEFLGVSAGGLVSPGYLAFFLDVPLRIVSTLALALLTFLAVRLIQRYAIVYGRRRFMAAVLVSLAGSWIFERLFFFAGSLHLASIDQDIRIVGYIIPGLIANDMLRQGAVKTILMTLLVALVLRLVLMPGLF